MNGQEPMKASHVEVEMPEKGAHLSEEGVIPLAATEGLNIFHLSKPNPFLKDLEPLKKAGLIPPGVLLYNANTPLRLLFRLSGTIVRAVLFSYSFWLIMSVHVFLSVMYYRMGFQHTRTDTTNVKHTDWPFLRSSTYTGFLGTLVSFCLVFQTTQSYNRFFRQYECCGEIVRNARAFHRAMRGVFDDGTCPGAKATRHRLYKYIIAKMYLGFAWLPHYRRVQVNVWVFDYLRREGFFTPQEAEQIANIPKHAKPFGMIAKWIQLLLHREQQRGNISDRALDRLMTNIRGLNRHVGILNEYASMPVPFAFYHLLNVMAIGYLLLLAYTQVFSSYFYGIFPMALTALVTLGLRELSNALADPFNEDDTDIAILDMAASARAEFKAILDFELPDYENKED
ncbi:hypothetical protein KFL_000360020 [Klebsormidium nitens]|uniref:Uncharacterized protein n=1 Tax=Klebsormidium nitens TaxID=105231 RepID=A0A1Y1HSZ7_KLENI|nr:hypothetical protein KFL_000360020 [Klebsormidium nitens]|eukprot:GAQ79686.1 hypothetical protein KFL_000360020 [Klebsormidium nitens]